MLNSITKIILILVIFILIFLIFLFASFSIFRSEINKNIDICYEKNNNLLKENLARIEKQKSGKEEICTLWNQSTEDFDNCVKKAYKTPYVFVATKELEDLQTLKEKQNKTCKEFPKTIVKNETILISLLGKKIFIDISPLVQSP